MTDAKITDKSLDDLRAEKDRLSSEVDELFSRNGDDPTKWDTGQTMRFQNLERAIDRVLDHILVAEVKRAERAEKIDAVRSAAINPANREDGVVGPGRTTTPGSEHSRARSFVEVAHSRYGLDDAVAEYIERSLKQPGSMSKDMAAWVEAAGNPDYHTAFAKRLSDPDAGHLTWTAAEGDAYRNAAEYARTSLSLSGASAMLPLTLDPTIAITNTGSTGGIGSVCRHEVTASNAWNGVTSAGATAEWKVENAQAADGTPAVAGKTIPVYMLDVDAVVSYEIEQDGLRFAAELQKVLLDAASVTLDAALATGSGSGAPTGIITALTGSSEVLTAGAFAAANVVSLQNALPARFQPKAQFVTGLAVRNSIGAFETTNGALRYPSASDGRLLNRPLVEDSNLSVDMTTSGSKFAVYGDWSQFLCVTRVGASIEILPNYGANGRPTASHHYFLTMRVGADALVTNAFRYLRKS